MNDSDSLILRMDTIETRIDRLEKKIDNLTDVIQDKSIQDKSIEKDLSFMNEKIKTLENKQQDLEKNLELIKSDPYKKDSTKWQSLIKYVSLEVVGAGLGYILAGVIKGGN